MPALAIGVTFTSTPAEAMFAGTLPNDTDGPSDAARTCGSAVGVGLAGTSPPTLTVAVAPAAPPADRPGGRPAGARRGGRGGGARGRRRGLRRPGAAAGADAVCRRRRAGL